MESHAEREIFDTYNALVKTYECMLALRPKIEEFQTHTKWQSITFLGCGSGFTLCKSAEISAKLYLNLMSHSFAAGDLFINYSMYETLLKKSLFIAPSRSGSTSEVIKAVKKAKETSNRPCIALCTQEKSELGKIADVSIELPWAFDESTCQTRTVTNLYAADLILIAFLAGNQTLIDDIRRVIQFGPDFINTVAPIIKDAVSHSNWTNIVVLADAELAGIAEEGALAFKEIAQMPSNYYHILDVRHGPMVLIDQFTLVILAASPSGNPYQKGIIQDCKQRGASVVVVSTEKKNTWSADMHFSVPEYQNYGVIGIPFILIPQLYALYLAQKRGINPDSPPGLKPWIKL